MTPFQLLGCFLLLIFFVSDRQKSLNTTLAEAGLENLERPLDRLGYKDLAALSKNYETDIDLQSLLKQTASKDEINALIELMTESSMNWGPYLRNWLGIFFNATVALLVSATILLALDGDADAAKHFPTMLAAIVVTWILSLLGLSNLCGFALLLGILHGVITNNLKQSKSISCPSPAELISTIRREYFDPKKSIVELSGSDVVGEASIIRVSLFQANGKEYVCSGTEDFKMVSEGPAPIQWSVETQTNCKIVTFSVTTAGSYQFRLLVRNALIKDGLIDRVYVAGPIDIRKCSVLDYDVCALASASRNLVIRLSDRYGNRPHIALNQLRLRCFPTVDTNIASSSSAQPLDFMPLSESYSQKVNIPFELRVRGAYRAEVQVLPPDQNDWIVLKDKMQLIALTEQEAAEIEKASSPSFSSGFDATILSDLGSFKNSNVSVYLTPKRIVIKYFYIGLFPSRVAMIRCAPITEVEFLDDYAGCRGLPVFAIGERGSPKIVLASQRRNIIFAIFCNFLRRRTGTHETFEQKRTQFNQMLRTKYGITGSKSIEIRRKPGFEFVKEAFSVLDGLKTSEWTKDWRVSFVGEQGLDAGGLRRELYTILAQALFDVNNGMFINLSEQRKAVVHPNANSTVPLKYFKFAGRVVGKILFQSAMHSHQSIPVRFSKSFYAQLLGLTITPQYMATDIPDLYQSKVQGVLEMDNVEDLDLTFSEDIVVNGQVSRTVDLKAKGRSITVTNKNRLEYVHLMCSYRLRDSCRDQADAFIAGLVEIVPDEIFGSFDENDLELLIGGASEIDVLDMRTNCQIIGRAPPQLMDWFWAIMASFSAEERSRLLQFSTGSASLPPRGFAELSPKFQISIEGDTEHLPTSHTCFNMICIPPYTSHAILHTKLTQAIQDGAEGFALR